MYRPPVVGVFGSSAGGADVESTIRGLTQDFCTAFNTGNYDQVGALYTADGVYMAPHLESVQGPKAIERLSQQQREAGLQTLRLETLRVNHSADMAVEIGHYTMMMQSAKNTNIADRGKFVRVWRRLGAWLIVADCWSSSLPIEQQLAIINSNKVA